MRLKPHEVRIINDVRRLRAGQVRVVKDEGGKLEVHTTDRVDPKAQQSTAPVSRPLKLRG